MQFNNFLKIPQAISKSTAELIAASLLIADKTGLLDKDQQQVVGSSICYSMPILEALLLQLLPIMEKSTNLHLMPTYAFARIYRKGDFLERHIDRPSCEISATLTLNYNANAIWPIFVEDSSNLTHSIELDVGDLLIYQGCNTPHWRDSFTGNLWIQVFLHYVDLNGPNVKYALDKRYNLIPLYKAVKDTLSSDTH